MLNHIVDRILSLGKTNDAIKSYGIIIASIMFIWSGIDKFLNFDKKITNLEKKQDGQNSSALLGWFLL